MLLQNLLKRFAPVALCALLVMLSIVPVLAQDSGGALLLAGEPIDGEFTTESVAQVFAFVTDGAGTVSLQVTAGEGLILSVLVSDAAGVILAQSTDIANSGVVGFAEIDIPSANRYYVTVFPAAGTDTELTGTFTVLLDGDIVIDPGTVGDGGSSVTTDNTSAGDGRVFAPGEVNLNGVNITLDWETTSDLNLEVRDPQGRRLYFDSVTTDNGGQFGFDVNGLCEVLIGDGETATETAAWSSGAVATGSYEILIYYRQDCESVGAVPATLSINVNGQVLNSIQTSLPSAESVYLTSFVINADGSAALGKGGLYTDTRVLPEPVATYLQAPATPLSADVAANGLITSSQYYQMYTFTGSANQLLTISMEKLDGNLDTLLLVLDQTGRIIGDNDDIISSEDTNSRIDGLQLPQDGVYFVLATRYGKDIGGTEGNYRLLLTSRVLDVPDEVAALDLPEGDIEVTLTWDTDADLQLRVGDPTGTSVFDDDRSITSGGQLTSDGNINCVAATTTPPTYFIYWPTSRARGGSYEVEVWYQNDCGDDTPVTATLYIRVKGQLLTTVDIPLEPDEIYLTSFFIDNSGNPVLGEGGITGGIETVDFSTEAPLPIAYGAQQNGIISPANKFDVYTFEGEAGDSVTITMNNTGNSSSLDPLLYLVDPDGFEAASNDDAVTGENKNSVIRNFVLPVDGTYTIITTHYGTIYGGTTGGYSLTLAKS